MFFRKAIVLIHGFAGGPWDHQNLSNELQLFIDSEVNGYPLKMLTKKYNVTNRVARGIISRVRETLAENISYNYYEGGQ